jgi:hypothetical protein
VGSMIICRRWSAQIQKLRLGTRDGDWAQAPAHLSIIFEILVCPAQLLYQDWI